MRGWGKYAYLCALALSLAHAGPREDLSDSSKIVQKTRLWTEPNKFGEAIAALEPGLPVDILEYATTGDWVKVKTPAGREGWVLVRTTTLSGRRTPDILLKGPQAATAPRDPAANGPVQPLMDGPAIEEPSAQTQQLPDTTISDPTVNIAPTAYGDGSEAVVSPQARREQLETTRKQNRSRAKSGAKASAVAGADTEFQAEGTRQLSMGVEYNHILSPESMAGVGLRANYYWRMNSSLLWGAGLDWSYNTTSVTDTVDAGVKVRHSHNRFQPNVGVRYEKNKFRIDTTLGWSIQKSSLRTIDLDTGLPIYTNSSGQAVTGSGWSHGIALRLAPAFLFPFESGFSMGFSINYMMRLQFGSSTGNFVGPATSKISHSIGGGLMAVKEF